MDKALRASLGWIACGIIILSFIYVYIYMKGEAQQVKDEYKSWIGANGFIKENQSTLSDTSLWNVEYKDKHGNIYTLDLLKSSINEEDKKKGKIKIFYNPQNPVEAKPEQDVIIR